MSVEIIIVEELKLDTLTSEVISDCVTITPFYGVKQERLHN